MEHRNTRNINGIGILFHLFHLFHLKTTMLGTKATFSTHMKSAPRSWNMMADCPGT